jgi:hypothetical protein
LTDAGDDDDRAIARALHADAPAPGPVDPHAVADYEAVLGYLPFAEVPPRDLEDQVVAAALARRPASARALESKRNASRGTRPSRPAVAALATVLAVAAAVVVVVLLVAGRSGPVPGSPGARIQPAAATGLSRVFGEPGTRQGALRTPAGAPAGQVVLGVGGDGFLTGLAPAAAPGATSWLWLDTGSGPVRVGQISDAAVVHFVVRGNLKAVRGVIVTSAPTGQVPSDPAPVSFRGSLPAA